MSSEDQIISEAAEPPVQLQLTAQQRRAMRAFLWDAGSRGFDDEACDGAVWDEGVRPWPTISNLERKGLVGADSWYGPDEGWNWRLTDSGRAYMTEIVAVRRALTQAAPQPPESESGGSQ